jgi:uncharacterized protein YfdQ (DUF2303 family)
MGVPESNQILAQTRDTQIALNAGRELELHKSTAKRLPELLHSKHYVILKDGAGAERVEYVTEQLAHPTFHKGLVTLLDGPSFIAYVNEHKTETSAVYASLNPCKFVAVLDEHPRAQSGKPAWRDFRATFTPALSVEWTTWMAKNGQKASFDSTEEFAYFIENNMADFTDPPAAAMLEMALNFKVAQSVTYKAARRLQDGQVNLEYVNEVNGTAGAGGVRIPEEFEIEIPIFAGLAEPPEKIKARLRYRLANGHLKLYYDLVRPEKILESAFKRLYNDIHEGIGATSMHLGITD